MVAANAARASPRESDRAPDGRRPEALEHLVLRVATPKVGQLGLGRLGLAREREREGSIGPRSPARGEPRGPACAGPRFRLPSEQRLHDGHGRVHGSRHLPGVLVRLRHLRDLGRSQEAPEVTGDLSLQRGRAGVERPAGGGLDGSLDRFGIALQHGDQLPGEREQVRGDPAGAGQVEHGAGFGGPPAREVRMARLKYVTPSSGASDISRSAISRAGPRSSAMQ
jgi:hypothetical protein